MMDDELLLRYSRQILLPEIDLARQHRLLSAKVFVVGVGGLGSPAAMYLAAAGIGELILSDHDQIDLSNLQRQILHTTNDIGRPKVVSAKEKLQAINPSCRVTALQERAEPALLEEMAQQVDLILDCSDNFATRFAINHASIKHRTPVISGAAVRWEGQVAVFSALPGDACYHCLYSEDGTDETRCATTGVVAPLVGIIGSMQALEAIKFLAGAGQSLTNRLLLFDGLRANWREVRLKPDPHCTVCSKA